jgi:serralysin
MARLASWTAGQILGQLDSGWHLAGTRWTYGFPADNSWIPNSAPEHNAFAPFTPQQQAAAIMAVEAWDDLVAPNIDAGAPGAKATIQFANVEGGGSYAYGYYPDAHGWSGSTVWMNRSYGELSLPVAGDYAFQTYLHEIGHALGLDHMGTYNGSANWQTDASSLQDSHMYSVMSYFAVWETGQANWSAGGIDYYAQTPMLNDVLAIQAMYGADPTTRTGATVYGFNASAGGVYDFSANLHPILTIYDANGIDTLDLSGYAAASQIDLVAGRYSSAAGLTNNIAIAFKTVIENAVGGAGNDKFAGNEAANLLSGGAGADQLSGAAGNDTLDGGAGNDLLAGGAGNDTYVIDGGGDTVTETSNAGTDTIVAGYSYSLGANLENLVLSGTANINGTGNASNNQLTGNGGDNLLTGGLGTDTLAGAFGNDSYLLDRATDVVVEAANAGLDTVLAAFSYTLGANLENLTLTGTRARIGTGNGLDNILIDAGGNSTLNGLDGNDVLFGGQGINRLTGGAGMDIFAFDRLASGQERDTITDFVATGAGHDLLKVSLALAADFADLVARHALVQSGVNTVLTLAGNESVTLLNVNSQLLTADDFLFA